MQKKLVLSGFTLVELLIVVAILTILFSIVIVAINPLRQIAQANNTKRLSDTKTLVNAVYQFATDHNGKFPTQITSVAQNISSSGSDICLALVPQYLAGLPSDPLLALHENITNCATSYDTGYVIQLSGSDLSRITISAPSAQNDEVISATE